MQHQELEKLCHCRFCGQIEETEHLLDFSGAGRTLQDYIEKIEFMRLDFIDLHCDFLPKTLCNVCYKFLLDCCDYFHKIKQTQIYLRTIYENSQRCLMQGDIKKKKDDDGHLTTETVFGTSVQNSCIKINYQNLPWKSRNKIQKCDTKILKSKRGSVNLKHNYLKNKKHSTVPVSKKRSTVQSSLKKILDTSLDSSKHTTDNKSIFIKREEFSWTDYNWICTHCQAKFNSMTELRDHSKVVHAMCFGFQCIDCTELFNYFNPFVEHVREHRPNLRLHCQFCNIKSTTAAESTIHSISHWSSSICTLCGEMLLSAAALDRHQRVYRKTALPQRCYKRKPKKVEGFISWDQYEWSCQDCSLSLPTVASLRAHTRTVHRKCFAMKCADCLIVLGNFKQFVEHVTAHRDCLKNFCPYCNAQIKESDVKDHISTHISGPQKPCLGCGEIFPDSVSLSKHKNKYDAPRVRGVGETDSLICVVCDKRFPNAFQLKNHKVIHNDKRERDQICHTCGKAFFDIKTLTNHIKTHSNKTETCEVCGKTFLTKQRLKVHITTHLELKLFVCDDCGKKFRRKSQLRLHLASHSDVLPFQCSTCSKTFRLQSYLKIHERQHTGIRPFTCEVCYETFNHWGNCNRHMIRKHGVTFAKTKITAQGKLDINKETGETKKISIEGSAREWCDEMLKPKKRGRKKKEQR